MLLKSHTKDRKSVKERPPCSLCRNYSKHNCVLSSGNRSTSIPSLSARLGLWTTAAALLAKSPVANLDVSYGSQQHKHLTKAAMQRRVRSSDAFLCSSNNKLPDLAAGLGILSDLSVSEGGGWSVGCSNPSFVNATNLTGFRKATNGSRFMAGPD